MKGWTTHITPESIEGAGIILCYRIDGARVAEKGTFVRDRESYRFFPDNGAHEPVTISDGDITAAEVIAGTVNLFHRDWQRSLR